MREGERERERERERRSRTASPGRYRNSGDGVAAASGHVGTPKQGQVALIVSDIER
jgi:hypothetical protein